MKYLRLEEATEINQKLITRYSNKEIIGVKDHNMLEAAIERPKQSAFGEDAYSSIYDKATALFESLAKNHPFQNGNKRTAYACMAYFLYENGYLLKMNYKVASDLTVDMVVGKYHFSEVSDIIQECCHKITQ